MKSYKILLISVLLSLSTVFAASPNQQIVIDSYNIYSANSISQDGVEHLYFGGWENKTDIHDAIYRATCSSKTKCTNIEVVVDPTKTGFNLINDPSIIEHPNGYYIMYITGVLEGKDGFDLKNNDIYYTTSWLYDGVNWATPVKLMDGYWLPSVLVKDDTIYVYSNDNLVHGGIVRHNLGTTGVVVGDPENVIIHDLKDSAGYSNVDVKYNSKIGQYLILAEKNKSDGTSVIDYLKSSDGLNWYPIQESVVVAIGKEYRVGTPSFSSDMSGLYFGSTDAKNSTDFQIYYQDLPEEKKEIIIDDLSCSTTYQPVCAQPKMLECPNELSCVQVMPATKTFPNSCEAGKALATVLYGGTCNAQETTTSKDTISPTKSDVQITPVIKKEVISSEKSQETNIGIPNISTTLYKKMNIQTTLFFKKVDKKLTVASKKIEFYQSAQKILSDKAQKNKKYSQVVEGLNYFIEKEIQSLQ